MRSTPRRSGADLAGCAPSKRSPGLAFSAVFVGCLGSGLIVRPARAEGGLPPPAASLPSVASSEPPPVQDIEVQGGTNADAASEVTVRRRELALRPRHRAEDLVEAVPGLFTVQHSGGAKAQQYFLRGFDADHGTDIAFRVDGVPVNSVSHAHGQGYSDLHFVIPELVLAIDATKGPYSARFGDFATAGTVELRFADRLPESSALVEFGPHHHARALVVESPELGDNWQALVAAELFSDAGYFVHSEAHRRFNGFARFTKRFDDDAKLSLTLMDYRASWYASGELPARAVCGEDDANPPPQAFGRPCLDRYDSIDPTQGGSSRRTSLSLAYDTQVDGIELRTLGYITRSRLALFLDETFVAGDPVHGDGIEQDDARTTMGAAFRAKHRAEALGMRLTTTLGLDARADVVVANVYHQALRQRLAVRGASSIRETSLGGFVENDAHITPWLRFVLGLRGDGIGARVGDVDPSAERKASGATSSGLVSPKWAAIVSPSPALDLFASYGHGFHSNDARGVVSSSATLFATATGYEVGITAKPLRHLSFTAVAFLLDLSSELVFNADEGTTEPSSATRREGLELTARYQLGDVLFADAALTLTRARFRYDDGAGTQIPLAPTRTFAAGVGVRKRLGALTPYGAVRIKSIAERPATQDGSLTADGFTLVDVQAGVRWKNLDVGIDALNVLDSRWREGQFAIDSRLAWEPKRVSAMSFTPGWPREVLAHVAVYW
jgi:outer membrane receptor protein involved in Fe transport